jgi:glycosyltransferase involved in cell wall biosynthesis
VRRALDLSLVIPAYNEARRLPATLAALHAYLVERPWSAEFLVVDDGSCDGTADAARALGQPEVPLRVMSLERNQGKGAAVKRGVAEAAAAYIGIVDADLPYGFEAFDHAIARLEAGADLVIGGRDLPGSSEMRGYGLARRVSGQVYSLLVNALAVRDIPDTQCGFKWLRRTVAKELFSRVTLTGFAFDVELLVLAQSWQLRIDRIPVRLTHSNDSRVQLVRDSARMFWDLLRINRRLARGDYDRRRPARSIHRAAEAD